MSRENFPYEVSHSNLVAHSNPRSSTYLLKIYLPASDVLPTIFLLSCYYQRCRDAQVVATILLSVVAGYSWLPLHKYRGASFAAAVFAYAVVRASNIVVRPSLNNLLGVAIGNSSTFGSGGGGRGTRRRTALKVVAVGVSQVIGVLVAGMIFARSAQTRAGATVLCFRLAAVAFVGVYMATLFVDATEGTGGFDAGWRGTGGTWLPACDFVEEAMAPASAGVRSMGGFGGMPTSTARRWGSSGSMAKES